MNHVSLDTSARQQRDRLFVAAAETVLHAPSVNAVYVILPAEPTDGPARSVRVNISASVSPPHPVSSPAARATTGPTGHDHFRWIGTLMNETDGVR